MASQYKRHLDEGGVRLFCSKIRQCLLRRKLLTTDDQRGEEELHRCLTVLDLVSLGVGSCCGSGLYIVLGFIAKSVAGPAIIISFLFGGFASILSGLCYGEFGERVPRTSGSSYVYSYVTIGEIVAFITGWNLILEYIIGTASGAVAISACIDSISHHAISDYMKNNSFEVIERDYPDCLGLGITLFMMVILAIGVKESVVFNKFLNAISLGVWAFIVIAGLFYIRPDYWTQYGFMPFGWSGVFSGAATCFYAFIGFDIIATTGEEAKNPSRAIPLSICLTLTVCLIVYISTSIILTMMVPYVKIDTEAALMSMFAQRGFPQAQYVVMVGALTGLIVAMMGSNFPMPRVIYAMAKDGLLFRFLAYVNSWSMTPVWATIFSGIIAALLAFFVGLQALIEMMSIGTLLAYTMVSMSVLLLRYRPTEEDEKYSEILQSGLLDSEREMSPITQSEADKLTPNGTNYGSVKEGEKQTELEKRGVIDRLRRRWNISEVATEATANRVSCIVWALIFTNVALCVLLAFADGALARCEIWAITLAVVLGLIAFLCVCSINLQPQSRKTLNFMAPLVPWLPCLAMFLNMYLMLKLSVWTWVRFAVWLALGSAIYFLYGIRVAGEVQMRIFRDRPETIIYISRTEADSKYIDEQIALAARKKAEEAGRGQEERDTIMRTEEGQSAGGTTESPKDR